VKKDFEDKKKRLIYTVGIRINTILASWEQYLKPSITKDTLLNQVRKGIHQAKEEEADSFLLYYSGHGDEETGGWICHLDEVSFDINDGRVNIEEILDMFKEE
jgi:hypothetical protein